MMEPGGQPRTIQSWRSPGPMSRSIRTLYRGTFFRSKLEADWARCLDALRIKWDYEPYGLYCGDVFVFPDFWLPDAKQWFEVKAKLTDYDQVKFAALARTLDDQLKPFVVFGWPKGVLSFVFDLDGKLAISSDEIGLGMCQRCGTQHFCEVMGEWACPKCSCSDMRWIRTQRPYDALTGTWTTSYEWSGWPTNSEAISKRRQQQCGLTQTASSAG